MKKYTKLEIRETIIIVDSYFFNGDVKDTLKNLSDIPAMVLARQPHHKRDFSKYHKYIIDREFSYDDSIEYVIIGVRWESEEEFKNRIDKLKKLSRAAKASYATRTAKKAEEEKELYLKLHKKYGKINSSGR